MQIVKFLAGAYCCLKDPAMDLRILEAGAFPWSHRVSDRERALSSEKAG
jgi:hypothetical protein